MICKICSSATTPFARAILLNKHDVQYFQCQNCGFVQTEEPYWLHEAYSETITNSDLGLLSRNISSATIARAVIATFFRRNAKFVDYGGGYGIFVRLMRDYGFDFYRYDMLCPNLFAKGFDVGPQSAYEYELVTAFEVFEHLVNPLAEIEQMLSLSRNILFSTRLVTRPSPQPAEWWYYGVDHGQHIALYTAQTLQVIADRFHLNLCSDGRSLHLLTERKLWPPAFIVASRYRVSRLLKIFLRTGSLLANDYRTLTGMLLD